MTQGILLVVFLIGLVTFHLLERWRRPVIAGRRTGPVRPDYLAEFTSAIVDGPVLTNLTKIAAYSLITLAPRYSNVLAHWNWWLQLA
ncbi:MAG: hypothetical protein HY269_07925, partial [Deltaproteobacteria bacterium]|nr:hypothetical protein [Deltaproteobacteria bacterium]